MSSILHKRNPVHKVQKMISRRSVSRPPADSADKTSIGSGMSPHWQQDPGTPWDADNASNATNETSESSPANEPPERDGMEADAGRLEATRAAAAALRATLRETDGLAARSADESVAAALAASVCERAVADVLQAEALKEREAAIALAVAEATAALAAEKETALAAARAAADEERAAAVLAAKEEARRERDRVVSELMSQLDAARAEPRLHAHAGSFSAQPAAAQHAAITRLIAEASPGVEGRDGVRYEVDAPATPPALPHPADDAADETCHRNVSLQTSLRASQAAVLESASRMPASLWRAHMWRTIVRVLWCA